MTTLLPRKNGNKKKRKQIVSSTKDKELFYYDLGSNAQWWQYRNRPNGQRTRTRPPPKKELFSWSQFFLELLKMIDFCQMATWYGAHARLCSYPYHQYLTKKNISFLGLDENGSPLGDWVVLTRVEPYWARLGYT